MPRGLLLEEVACVPGCSREQPPPLCTEPHTCTLGCDSAAAGAASNQSRSVGMKGFTWSAASSFFFPPFILRESRLRESWRWQPIRNFHFWHRWLSTESNLLLWSPFNAPSRWPGREGEEGVLWQSEKLAANQRWRSMAGRDECAQGTAGRTLDLVVAINQRTNVQTWEKARKQTPPSLSAAHFWAFPQPVPTLRPLTPRSRHKHLQGFVPAFGVVPFSCRYILQILAVQAIPTICTGTINPQWAGCFPLGSFKVHINQWLMKSRDLPLIIMTAPPPLRPALPPMHRLC